jgi:DNA-directed RNA polymerase specialized sigma24 family protein
MKKVFNGLQTALLLLLLIGCVDVAVAQQAPPYKVSEEEVRNLLQRLEERADGFRSLMDIVLEVSRLDGTSREDRLDLLVADFERAVDGLEERFNKGASIAHGLSNKEIAAAMQISVRTVENHVSHILDKKRFNNRVEIARHVFEQRTGAAA